MPFLESPDGAWIQAQLAHMTQQARDSGRYDKNLTQAELFCPGSDELRDTISKLDLNLLKERARLMGLPGPMFGGVEEVSVIAELAGRGSEGGI
ncbi:hypothetical protein MMC30_004455 [Trapelia coarctata]|nr:hypothetical protein [Trapelia coarctata]